MDSIWEEIENCIGQLKLSQLLHEADSNNREVWRFVIQTLIIMTEELKQAGTFGVFESIIRQEILKSEQKCQAIGKLEDAKKELIRLSQSIHKNVLQYEAKLKGKDLVILEQTELEALKIQNELELGFTKIWFREQIEENTLKCEMELGELNRFIAELKNDIDEEKNVHIELTQYYENEKKKTEELITYWKQRYQDIEEGNSKLESLKKKSQEQREELEFFETTFQKRKEEMETYLADKERRNQELEYEQFRHKMATKIQAWWRGVMVRRCLGPYKYLLRIKIIKKRKTSLKKKNQ